MAYNRTNASRLPEPTPTLATAKTMMQAAQGQDGRYVATDAKGERRLRTVDEILLERNFEPLKEAIELFERAKASEKWVEARKVLTGIMEFTYAKHRAQETTHHIRSIQIVYADQLPPDQQIIDAESTKLPDE